MAASVTTPVAFPCTRKELTFSQAPASASPRHHIGLILFFPDAQCRGTAAWQAELRHVTVLLKAGEARSGIWGLQHVASFLSFFPVQEPSSQEAKIFREAATSSCFTPMGTFSLFSNPVC